MRRAPPRSSAEIQTCFTLYPWQALVACPAAESARRNTRPPESSEPKKKTKIIFYIYIWGTVAVKAGYKINSIDFVGYSLPSHVSVRGGQVAPSFFAAASLAPTPRPKNKKKRCARSAWAAGVMAARQNSILSPPGASAGAFRGRYLSVPLNHPKTRRYTPFDLFPCIIRRGTWYIIIVQQ